MSQEYVFRFLTVRPGNQLEKVARAPKTVPVYEGAEDTPLAAKLKELHDSGASDAEVLRAIRGYQESGAHVKFLDDLPLAVDPALRWITEKSRRKVSEIDFDAAVGDLHGQAPPGLVTTEPFRLTRERLSDTLVSAVFHMTWKEGADRLASARKWIALIELLAGGGSLDPDARFGPAFAELSLSIPDFARMPAPPPRKRKPVEPVEDPSEAERESLRRRLADLETAHRELSRKAVEEDAVVEPQTPPEDVPSKLSELERRIALVERSRSSGGAVGRFDDTEGVTWDPGEARVVLSTKSIASLPEAARVAIADARIDLGMTDPIRAVQIVEREIMALSGRLAATERPDMLLLMGGVMLDLEKARGSLLGTIHEVMEESADPCRFEAGVGDLLMVRQDLKAYELAEFAHVENVLAGEARKREHRRLNVREEIVTQEEERETEKERNLQSTERNEMQSEAEKTVKSQFELEAGLQVSGSYGPAVSFSASLNAGFSTSTEETQRKAVTYSREVTEKTSERVRERVKQELRRRMLEQVEEVNRHSITNVPASNGHVRGIYRWLNKVYDAQILNYGQRMMFEFVVPEPAAYLLYALIENPPQDNELVKPAPPTFSGAPLKPSHLTRANYLDYVARYQVRNAPVPPPEFQHVTTFDKQDKVDSGSIFGRSTKVEVPAGYEAYAASVMGDYIFTEGRSHHFRVMVGGESFDISDYWGSTYKHLSSRYKELGVAYHLFRAWSFAVAIDVHCRLTAEGFAKWQQQAFDSIMEAYLVQKADYDEKLAALQIQQGVKILGRNPLENRRIEREELKKLVLMMLTRNNDIARDSMLPDPEPRMDLQAACSNGSWIRFFENAFEWNNVMYVFYPYFWGRAARWISALHFTDPDPDFAAFLKAGAARVQVPVRPGFERAVAHFCQFNQIWEGNDPPLLDDDLYVPIVDEIAENLGKLDDGVPYPEGSEPWEVRIPTSLVLVQDLEEIPGIKDTLTGNDVGLTS